MEDGKPTRKWGLKQTMAAGTIMTVGQLYAFYDFVLPRKEAEAQNRMVNERFERVENALQNSLRDLHADLSSIRLHAEATNRSVSILMYELKKKSAELEDERDRAVSEPRFREDE